MSFTLPLINQIALRRSMIFKMNPQSINSINKCTVLFMKIKLSAKEAREFG